jgi:hypothetical protein
MTTQREREQRIVQATMSISGLERGRLEGFIEQTPPSKQMLEDGAIRDKSLMIETSNKSNPYLEVRRNLELDQDGNPCFAFSLIAHKISGNKEDYLGTFGQQEMKESIIQIPKQKKRVSKKKGLIPDDSIA